MGRGNSTNYRNNESPAREAFPPFAVSMNGHFIKFRICVRETNISSFFLLIKLFLIDMYV